jgi:YgiT-type zinc finger domain-containing protein
VNENTKCTYCGGERFEERRVKYIYSRGGKHLFVPDMPADVCLDCGMIYYHGPALLKVEERFKAIHQDQQEPDRYEKMPVMEYVYQ